MSEILLAASQLVRNGWSAHFILRYSPRVCLFLPQKIMDLGQVLGTPTCMAHPDTYLNKLLVGGASGRLQLWNFESGQMLHGSEGW